VTSLAQLVHGQGRKDISSPVGIVQGSSAAAFLTQGVVAVALIGGWASIPMLTVMGVLNGCVGALAGPSSSAMTRQTVAEADLPRAVAGRRLSQNAAMVLGFSLAGVLVYLYPAIVAVLSIRYATRLSGRRPWIALGIALVGVILALGGIDLDPPPPVYGLVLILASPLIYAGWIVLSARLAGERTDRLAHESPDESRADDAAAATTLMISATAAVFVGAAIVTGRPLAPGRIPSEAWPYLVAIGFASTFLAIQTFYAGAQRIGAAQAALVSTVEPLMIVSLAAVLLGDVLAPVQLVGAGLILIGVVIAQTGARPRGAPEPAMPLDGELRSEPSG